MQWRGDYIRAPRSNTASCLLLDLQLPDLNGLELQRQLAGSGHPPIIFISAAGDIASSVNAMKAGAVDFLPKPFDRQALLAAIETALARHRAARELERAGDELRGRYDLLTARERDVLPLIVSGALNKQAAAVLGISIVTVQIHRSRIMRKMAARSLAELVRMAATLRVPLRVGGAVQPR